MKKIIGILSLIAVWGLFSTNAYAVPSAFDGDGSSAGTFFVTGLIGFDSYTETDEPFDKLFRPIGGSIEFMLTSRVGIGGTLMYYHWSDYLGMYGGKYTFRIYRPTIDLVYHLDVVDGLDVFAGAGLGQTSLSVGNELGNEYPGSLESESFLAPLGGIRLRLFDRFSPLGRIMLTFRAMWIPSGDYSGFIGSGGITIILN